MSWKVARWFGLVQRGYIFLSIGFLLAVVGLVGDLLGYRRSMGAAALVFMAIGQASLHRAKQANKASPEGESADPAGKR